MIIDRIDPSKTFFGERRLYRQQCVPRGKEGERIFVKDLRVIEDRDLSDLLLVDNSILSFAF
jgi:CTD small phosphatase-like protein 2